MKQAVHVCLGEEPEMELGLIEGSKTKEISYTFPRNQWKSTEKSIEKS